ncbi:carbohydrate kinase [Vagococcus sp. BWB3-3]|uniref:Carbohydrate kinase n=1 Tax=Vagococcus allomyrinae TaxID=2794353 RepID=A0A940SYN5_9ENTE|nr:FGGY-family carbohydrate kinase [Vagococcus allomyrinae]MBP1043573.1 carbohydrate kinase [Vagococcus allomyrinae]
MNEKTLFLTIDSGGTKTKVVIHDITGKQLAVSSFPTKGVEVKRGFREIDLHEFWEAIQQGILEAVEQESLDPTRIIAISVVGHGKGLYPLNQQGNIFTQGILSTDERGEELAEKFSERIEELWPLTNQSIVGAQAPVLLYWLKQYERKTYEKIGWFLSSKDFIRYQLTGSLKQERGDASGNNLVNFQTKEYDDRILEFFDITEMKSCLPPLIDATDHQATVSEEVAKRTGIPEGTPVLGGLFDIQACTLATGVLNSASFSLIAGTWSINVYPSAKPIMPSSQLMMSLLPSFFNEYGYLIEASSATSAGNLELMIDILLSDEKQRALENHKTIYDDLEELLANTSPDFAKMYYLPFLYGSNGGQGAKASFIGLSSTSSKSEMIKAVYEGIVFGHKQHVEQLIATGKLPEVIRLSGGAANSAQWAQLFADIINIPVETVEGTELGALGGMILAVYALGNESEIATVMAQTMRIKKRFEPRASFRDIYQKKYRLYKKIIYSHMTIWDDLNKINREMEG